MIRPFSVVMAICLEAPFLFAQAQDPAQEAQRANELVANGKLDEAISIYDRLIRAFPSNPGLLLNLCIAEFKSMRYLDAVEHARAALKLKPDLAPADLFLGASYLELHEPASALAPLRKALDAMPGDPNAHLMLAEALLACRRYEEALKEFRKTSDLSADNPKVWCGLGQVYDALSERAARDLETNFPDSVYSAVLAGDSYVRQRRFGSAFAAYREALAKSPVIPGIHAGLARVYKQTGHSEWAAHEETLEANVAPVESINRGPASSYRSWKSYRQLADQAYDRLAQLPPSFESHLHTAKALDANGRGLQAKVKNLLLAHHRWGEMPECVVLAYWTKSLRDLPDHDALARAYRRGFQTRAMEPVEGTPSGALFFYQFILKEADPGRWRLDQVRERGVM